MLRLAALLAIFSVIYSTNQISAYQLNSGTLFMAQKSQKLNKHGQNSEQLSIRNIAGSNYRLNGSRSSSNLSALLSLPNNSSKAGVSKKKANDWDSLSSTFNIAGGGLNDLFEKSVKLKKQKALEIRAAFSIPETIGRALEQRRQSKLQKELERKNFVYKRANKTYAYDEALARQLIELSKIAYTKLEGYERKVEIRKRVEETLPTDEEWKFVNISEEICCETGFTEVFFWTVSDKKRELNITFRGTMSNWQLFKEFVDTISKKVPWNENDKNGGIFGFYQKMPDNEIMEVNRYYLATHKQMRKKLDEVLTKFKGYKITFHGHSLGGALAALAALYAVESGILRSEQVQLYTFAQSRVGNFAFAKYFDKLVPNGFRIVNGKDPIPHWPLFDIGQHGNYHHSTEIWYENGYEQGMEGDYRICDGFPHNEDPNCSNQYEFSNAAAMALYGHQHRLGST